MSFESLTLVRLRRQIAALGGVPAVPGSARVAMGHGPIDEALKGGLARGRMHEWFGDAADEGTAAGLVLAVAGLAAGQGTTLWLRPQSAQRAPLFPYGPGLAALGMESERLLIGDMPDEKALLRAGVEALRCPVLGALVIEMRGNARGQGGLDLTASRRLVLAAEASGVTVLVLRIGGEPAPSAADTRWQVRAAPSPPLADGAPGMSAFDLTLLRRRSGPDGMTWRAVWDSGRGMFAQFPGDERDDAGQGNRGDRARAPLSGHVVPLSADRPPADRAA